MTLPGAPKPKRALLQLISQHIPLFAQNWHTSSYPLLSGAHGREDNYGGAPQTKVRVLLGAGNFLRGHGKYGARRTELR